jgi:hypothetical protein
MPQFTENYGAVIVRDYRERKFRQKYGNIITAVWSALTFIVWFEFIVMVATGQAITHLIF